jgi:2-polyprenyl-3-methyl-5-hydroxy-6-metoxy-1,4-benzoquinol methylase
MSNDRIARIRESEKKSHTEIYSNEKLYSSDSWLRKPIKTVREISELFSVYDTIHVLDLGAGVGRNSIYLAEKFKSKDCLVDCVDLLDIAIEKLNQNAAEHNVKEYINGIANSIEEYTIEPDSYDLIMAVSALEHVENKSSLISKLEEMKQGIRPGGVVLLVINSEVKEINADTSEELDPQFEVNLQTSEMQAILDETFEGWEVIKKTVVSQEYDIPRDGITSRLSTNVVTYVGRKKQASEDCFSSN